MPAKVSLIDTTNCALFVGIHSSGRKGGEKGGKGVGRGYHGYMRRVLTMATVQMLIDPEVKCIFRCTQQFIGSYAQ